MWKPPPAFQRILFRKVERKFRRAATAELVASLVEFEQAELLAADEDERRILRDGLNSASVLDQISAAILARLILARTMDQHQLVRYVQHLQGRYEVAVGPVAYGRYLICVPQDVFENLDKLKAELQTLSYRLRLAYAISYKRDRELHKLRVWCAVGLGGAILVIMSMIMIAKLYATISPFLNYPIVALIGLAGAITSIARRANQILSSGPLSEDPVMQASALEEGSSSLWVAVLTGPVFALILLLLFMSGNVDLGGLTPMFEKGTLPSGKSFIDFSVFNYPISLADAVEGAKLAIWSFVAGFAEQFVPDVLDRFTKVPDQKS